MGDSTLREERGGDGPKQREVVHLSGAGTGYAWLLWCVCCPHEVAGSDECMPKLSHRGTLVGRAGSERTHETLTTRRWVRPVEFVEDPACDDGEADAHNRYVRRAKTEARVRSQWRYYSVVRSSAQMHAQSGTSSAQKANHGFSMSILTVAMQQRVP